jgi:hypothetical protein
MKKNYINESSSLLEDLYKNEKNKIRQFKNEVHKLESLAQKGLSVKV